MTIAEMKFKDFVEAAIYEPVIKLILIVIALMYINRNDIIRMRYVFFDLTLIASI